jgi:hypothetical protein
VERPALDTRTEPTDAKEQGTTTRAAWMLMAAGALSLCAAGLVLWSDRGAAVFSDTVLAALAWCF